MMNKYVILYKYYLTFFRIKGFIKGDYTVRAIKDFFSILKGINITFIPFLMNNIKLFKIYIKIRFLPFNIFLFSYS